MAPLDEQLDAALNAMEVSFHVRLIGTFPPDLIWVPADAEADGWLANSNPDFDQFPVKQGDATVGILRREDDLCGKTVLQAMESLRDGLIVSADMPIAQLIPQLRETHYRLILRGDRIDGLVTQSDLLKLPVRLLVFALITHLEQVMADVVTIHWPQDSWFDKLSAGRQTKIADKERELRNRGMNPPRIELTEFGDKRDLCKKIIEANKKTFDGELDELLVLRDQIAHAATFVEPTDGKMGVVAFVDKFESAKRWIQVLTELVRQKQAGNEDAQKID